MPVRLMLEQIAAIKAMKEKRIGHVSAPTSFGKTVTIFGHIKEQLSTIDKLCSIITGPIMDLNQQTVESVLTNLLQDGIIETENCEVSICNSRNTGKFMVLKDHTGKIHLQNKTTDGYERTGIKVVPISQKQEKKFRLVVACNPTMQNNKKVLDFLNDEAITYNFYFDECQSLGEEKPAKQEGTEVIENDCLDYKKIFEIVKNKGAVYFISATHTDHNFNILKKYVYHNDNDCFVYRCSPCRAIDRKMILPPEFHVQCYSELNIEAIKKTIDQVVKDINGDFINGSTLLGKVLITVNNTMDLIEIKKFLRDIYPDWDVFTTCSEYGKTFNEKDLPESISEFKTRIDAEDKNCFIVHIKQIICGVDIPSFTHAVFNMEETTNLISPIQITGRVLRPYKRFESGEADTELKKNGKVYINVTASEKSKQACRTLHDYYGQTFEYLKPAFSSYTNGSDIRTKTQRTQFDSEIVSNFDEWIEKFLTKLAISCFQDKDLGIESNIKGIVADKIIEFGYIPNLPKFYQPELDKYVNFVLDRMNAFELARQAMVI